MASSSSSPASSSYSSPCAACKFLRRKCMPGCIFAPYFPPEEPQKFANVHKIFGASNVTKLLNDLHPHRREDAVNSLAYEAEARVRDPVYGCVGAISYLQRQVQRLQKELDAANADLIRFHNHNNYQAAAAAADNIISAAATQGLMELGTGVTQATSSSLPSPPPSPTSPVLVRPAGMDFYEGGVFFYGGGGFGIPTSFGIMPWRDDGSLGSQNMGEGGDNV